MESKISVKLVGDSGMKSPGWNRLLAYCTNWWMSTPFLDSLLHTFVWKSANLCLMVSRFWNAKAAAPLIFSVGETAANKQNGRHTNTIYYTGNGVATPGHAPLQWANQCFWLAYAGTQPWCRFRQATQLKDVMNESGRPFICHTNTFNFIGSGIATSGPVPTWFTHPGYATVYSPVPTVPDQTFRL